MHYFKRTGRLLKIFLLAASLCLAIALDMSAQELEIEPNHPCAAAQSLGSVDQSLTLNGSIDNQDIDYYTLFALPNASATVRLRGSSSGLGTLADPLLGILSSDCSVVLALNDDFNGLDSQVQLTVSANGSFVVAATSYADFGLTGAGFYTGSYQLSLDIAQQTTARSVSGRIVDARTGSPVYGANVTLVRCPDGVCSEFMGSYFTWSDGGFRFESGVYPLYVSLQAGDYRIIVSADNFETRETDLFYLAPGEERDLGDVPLMPFPRIGSIRGRVVDLLTGAPLPGVAVPYTFVELQYCYDEWSCYPLRYASPDAEGRFQFESSTWNLLPPGTYQIRASADQYETATGPRFTVGDAEHYDSGDLALKSFPVRIYSSQPCGPIPSQGGHCKFTVQIVNGMPGRLQGEAWSVVSAFGIGAPTQSTIFQTGVAKALSLGAAASTILPFSFQVPASVNNGAYICVQTLVAQRPHSFNTLGSHYDFCLIKGVYGFMAVPEERKREAVEKSKGDRPHPPLRKP